MSEVKTMAKFGVPQISYSRKDEEQGLIYESTNPPTYDEMLGKLAGMSYESPIDIVCGEVQFKFEQDVMKAIQSYDIRVDRDELIKALQYDRHQYEKGFADACKLNTKGEWINVEDRLPEKEGKYLICNINGYVTFGYFGDFDGDGKIKLFRDNPRFDYRNVFYWMPVPEPPK